MVSLKTSLWTAAASTLILVVANSAGCSADSAIGGANPNNARGGSGGGFDFGGNFGTGGGVGTPSGCTADLQQTVDSQGNIVATCAADLGCFEGQCVPACEAAAKSRGSIGCEYWAATPPFYFNDRASSIYDGACFAVFVANSWSRPAKLTVKYQGTTFNASDFGYIPSGVGPSATYSALPATGVPPGEVAVLFLSHKPGAKHGLGASLECPRAPAVKQDTAAHSSARGNAFELLSDTPLTAYDIMPYGGAESYLPSASLLYPRTAWGDNYIAVAPHEDGFGKPWVLLVGRQDGTTVKVAPPNTLPAGTGVAQAPNNAVTQFTLDAGQVLQWMGADPTGAVFQASNPIGVSTGTTYLRVRSTTSPTGGGQDSAHQQLPPISALGSEYVGGSVVTRLQSMAPESVPYRILGVIDGTQLILDPPQSGAPSTINAGEVFEFETTDLFVVSSQDADHAFMLSQYMPGTPGTTRPGCSPNAPLGITRCGLGDEEWVVLLPPRQFLSTYAFFTDPTYATTNLVLTRVAGANGFSDVDIACLGKVSGWIPVGSGGTYEVAHVDLIRGGTGATSACETSQHFAKSEGAFGVMVWGTDYYASYGYPAGGNVGVINDIAIVPEVPK